MNTNRPTIHRESGNAMDYSDLDERFTRYYESGERVEVTLKEGHGIYMGYGNRTDGRKIRFYVGKSGGWKPIYLMILTRRSYGGMAILSEAIESIRGLGIYKH